MISTMPLIGKSPSHNRNVEPHKRRFVHFTASRVIHFTPWSKSEIPAAWYSNAEMDSIRRRAFNDTIRLAENRGGDLECGGRGLEHRISPDRIKRKKLAIAAVVEVQRRLRGEKMTSGHDPGIVLALVAERLTRPARKVARYVGDRDFARALGVYAADGMAPPSVLDIRKNRCPASKRTLRCKAHQSTDSSAAEEMTDDESRRRVRMKICIPDTNAPKHAMVR